MFSVLKHIFFTNLGHSKGPCSHPGWEISWLELSFLVNEVPSNIQKKLLQDWSTMSDAISVRSSQTHNFYKFVSVRGLCSHQDCNLFFRSYFSNCLGWYLFSEETAWRLVHSERCYKCFHSVNASFLFVWLGSRWPAASQMGRFFWSFGFISIYRKNCLKIGPFWVVL